MKSFEAESNVGMTETEVREFLSQSKSTLLLGTSDETGNPSIHPVWYYFDSAKTRLYLYTGAHSKKAQHIQKRAQGYFDVDLDVWPYKGVKGKGDAKIITDLDDALSHTKTILAKYLKSGHPMIEATLQWVREGRSVVVEITPAYFTSWDYGKLQQGSRNDMLGAVES